ncbi:beta-galactosidase [Cohnella ginsengisoli]|uniref:Beta-galactosidase n=1 Tax=Cohnella ginsengisoli TaxID=425004 RepID=A0A9X4KFZ8_9BACL|nr:beta-galactosidase [Cohnella ginsengisoli]MDG0791519.1 beta-galactosidase [Cohnella ginsengisoli]
MNEYRIDASQDRKKIRSGASRMGGSHPSGERLGLSNYYMEKNGKPFFGICGEFHYSRYDERFWEDEIVKMKMGGINIVATYIFWNVHEEIRGEFDWSGRRDLRRFIELCGKHDLYVIIRIGPFDHGEMRNGGMPDWLFGRPFEVRSNDPRYLAYVKPLYEQISAQVQGLLYKQGGPIIGTQIENEHNHSAAQWALTTGISNQWLTRGEDGEAHMLTLKKMAIEAGINTPIYTCTAWGGASAPADEMLPLWGGYSHWPWIYYEEDRFGEMKEHPATPEYIFRDKHNNDIPKSYNFEPLYTPEDHPYACCEMGGGMTPFYKYRFDFPYISVPAMTGIKVAEGCNLIGYYMYHGGSNPNGKRDVFLNDLATPKISYDFNACIGEFGQVRESYHRTRLQHYFYVTFEEWLCRTKTILPGDTSQMEPTDVDTLRYAVRAAEGTGLLFLNNYQDHAKTHDLHVPGGVTVQTATEEIRFPAEGGARAGQGRLCHAAVQLRSGRHQSQICDGAADHPSGRGRRGVLLLRLAQGDAGRIRVRDGDAWRHRRRVGVRARSWRPDDRRSGSRRRRGDPPYVERRRWRSRGDVHGRGEPVLLAGERLGTRARGADGREPARIRRRGEAGGDGRRGSDAARIPGLRRTGRHRGRRAAVAHRRGAVHRLSLPPAAPRDQVRAGAGEGRQGHSLVRRGCAGRRQRSAAARRLQRRYRLRVHRRRPDRRQLQRRKHLGAWLEAIRGAAREGRHVSVHLADPQRRHREQQYDDGGLERECGGDDRRAEGNLRGPRMRARAEAELSAMTAAVEAAFNDGERLLTEAWQKAAEDRDRRENRGGPLRQGKRRMTDRSSACWPDGLSCYGDAM